MHKTFHTYFIFILSGMAIFFPSCITEEWTMKTDKDIQFTIQLPSGTFSNNPDEPAISFENEVNTIDVLIFSHTEDRFYKRALAQNITGTGETRTFQVTLPTGQWKLVILANAAEWIVESFPSGISLGTPYANIQAQLQASVSGKWITDPSSPNYKPIPMWGEKENSTINQNTTDLGSITVSRMIAAIDIILSEQAQELFEIEQIYLYNYNQKGLLIPNTLLPSLPSSPLTTQTPLLYDNANSTDKTQIKNQIYLFETEKGSGAGYPNHICLVVGGLYKPTGTKGFYRIDFADKTDGIKQYKPILRNHKYTILVKSVDSSGLPTEEDAYNSIEANIETEIREWNLIDINPDTEIRTLSVSPLKTSLLYIPEQICITVKAQLPASGYWTATLSSSKENITPVTTDWIYTLTPGDLDTPRTENIADLFFEVEVNNGYNDRAAYLHITAGKLTVVAEIYQMRRIVSRSSVQNIQNE